MTRRVFHEADPLAPRTVVALAPEEAHYLLRVRRAALGDPVEVLDGRGGHYRGRVLVASGPRCEIRLDAAVPAPVVPPLVLLLGLPDGRAALDAITCATELGATTIVLVRCARSQAGVPSPARITRTIRAAQRQCGRAVPPEIVGPVDLSSALARADPRPGWVAITEERHTPTELRGPCPGATILIGPEGGLSPEEVGAARTAGLAALSLGPFVLRTETAVGAALARAVGALHPPGAP